MTFRVICTGKNKYYGKKGEKKILGDTYVLDAIKEDWIMTKIEYLGINYGKSIQDIPIKKEMLPIKKVDIQRQLEIQNNAMKRIREQLKWIEEKHKEIISLIKSASKKLNKI